MRARTFKAPSKIVHTERTIQRQIVQQYLNQAKYMVPNMHYELGEMDMFLCRRGSGYSEEFEIKISTADFNADANKFMKHRCFHNFSIRRTNSYKMIPNRFSYVVGEAVDLSKIVVPEYAGLFQATNYGLRCIKSPPFIHKTKHDWTEKVAKSTSFRYLRAAKLIGKL